MMDAIYALGCFVIYIVFTDKYLKERIQSQSHSLNITVRMIIHVYYREGSTRDPA